MNPYSKCVINFWQKIVYPKPKFQKWHSLDYIKGKCQNCSLKLLGICPMEKDLKNEIILTWKCFQEVHACWNYQSSRT